MLARRVGCRDELALAVAALGQLQADADLNLAASGASAGVLPAEVADALRAGRRLDAGAEKLVDLELGVRAVGGLRSAVRVAEAAAQAPYKPDAGPSAARSFAGREPAGAAVERERLDAQLVPSASMADLQSGLDLPVRSLQAELQSVELPAH